MKALITTLCLVVASAAQAQQPRVYAVMSLVGDGLLLVSPRPVTGTLRERVDRQFVPMTDTVLDRTALQAVGAAVKKAQPDGRTILFAGREPDVLQAQQRALEHDGATQAIADALRPKLPPSEATHLILVAKHRAKARLHLKESDVGQGLIDGLGFYVDRSTYTERADNHEMAQGFLAPFAYFTVALVDLASGRVVREEPVTASNVIPQAQSATLNPWDALTGAQKVEMLQGLIGTDMPRAVSALLASS